MFRRDFVSVMSLLGIGGIASGVKIPFAKSNSSSEKKNDRVYTTELLYKITKPVLLNLSQNLLKVNMPLEKSVDYNTTAEKLSYLEAFGRTICGVAPWLNLPDDNSIEGNMRKELKDYAIKAMDNAVNPNAADYMNFSELEPPLVHAAHLCQGLLRAPDVLWHPLSEQTKFRFIAEIKKLRRVKGPYNNWLLFSGMLEAFLLFIREDYEPLRIMLAIKKIQEWYVGDGWYKDGVNFSFDYYNGYVIHSMYYDILKIAAENGQAKLEECDQALRRMQRFAVIQERLIAPDGSYPAVGRSMTYRTAAFQPIAQLSLMKHLPAELSGAQVRSALTSVMKKIFDTKGTFDKNGWLQLGLAGHQPELADVYTSTGSLYICTEGFLALGLPADDEFWTRPAEQWTAQKVWAGLPVTRDHSLEA